MRRGLELFAVDRRCRRPLPPSVKLRPHDAGKPTYLPTCAWPLRTVRDVRCAADSRPIFSIACLELLAVFGLVDHVGIGADHLDAVFFEHAVLGQVHRQVEPRLAAERRQQRIGPLPLDDLVDDLPGERLDVGAVGRCPDRS